MQVRKEFILLLSVLAVLRAQGQAFPADSIYTVIRNYNAYSTGANWDSIGAVFKENLTRAETRDDSIEAVVHVFTMLDDVHSTLTVDNIVFSHYHAVDEVTLEKLDPLITASNANQGKIFDTVFPDGVGYIRIPSLNVWGDMVQITGQDIQHRICGMLDQRIKGCIVDLRLNTGGNMYPMLSGLYPLLGNNVLLHTTFPDSSVQFTWGLQKGNLYAMNNNQEKTMLTELNAPCKPSENMQVMVLVGPVTMSSGQATAVAFVKRNNTLIIGEPTADGYITAKNYYPFGNGIVLNMSSGFISDRENTIYTRLLNPQLWILGGDNFEDLQEDLKMQMSRWRILNK